MRNFKDMNMIIKQHKWNKLASKTGIKEGSSSLILTVTVSLISTSVQGNSSCQQPTQVSSFAFHLMIYNHKHPNWIWRTFLACNEVGLQTIHDFSRMQNLGSRRAFILRSTLFLLFPASIKMPQIYKTLNLSNNTHILLFLNFLSFLFFYFSSFYWLLIDTIFLYGCYLSYHNYHSPKFGANLLWTMMLSYNLKKGRWRL